LNLIGQCASNSVILGGISNRIFERYGSNVVSGGTNNTVQNCTSSVILGGSCNRMTTRSNCGIIGGTDNQITTQNKVVIAGGSNVHTKVGSLNVNWLHVEGMKTLNAVVVVSDERNKKDIQYIENDDFDVITLLKNIKPASWQWNFQKREDPKRHSGFIAQDLMKYLPTGPNCCLPLINSHQTITHKLTEKDGSYFKSGTKETVELSKVKEGTGPDPYFCETIENERLGLDTGALTTLLYMISKKQQEYIDDLQERVNTLENK
jgi:hypothetical protein